MGLRRVPTCEGVFKEIAGCPSIFTQFEAKVLAADAPADVTVVDGRQSNGGSSEMRTKHQAWLLAWPDMIVPHPPPSAMLSFVPLLVRC